MKFNVIKRTDTCDYTFTIKGDKHRAVVHYPLNNNSAVVKALLSNRIWEKKITDIFIKHIGNDDVVVDCGAYIGTHTLTLSRLSKQVYSFEPQRLVGKCLKKTLSSIENVVVNDIALYSKETEALFGTNNDGDASIKEFRRKTFADEYLVKCNTLDSFNYDKINFIKIDAEGAEFKVLKGAEQTIKRNKPKIIVEVFKHKKNNIIKWATEHNYNIEQINCENYFLTPQ